MDAALSHKHTQIHKCVHSGPLGLFSQSPEDQDSEEQRVLSHCDQFIGLKLSKHTLSRVQRHSAGVAVVERVLCCHGDGEWCHSTYPKKGAAGMLFILKNTTLAPIAVRKCKVPDISTFCSRLALHRKAPAISLPTWRIIPTETQEMCSTTEAKQEGPVPNLNLQNTHTYTLCLQSTTTRSISIEELRQDHSRVSPVGERRNTQLHTHTHAHMQRHKTT